MRIDVNSSLASVTFRHVYINYFNSILVSVMVTDNLWNGHIYRSIEP